MHQLDDVGIEYTEMLLKNVNILKIHQDSLEFGEVGTIIRNCYFLDMLSSHLLSRTRNIS